MNLSKILECFEPFSSSGSMSAYGLVPQSIFTSFWSTETDTFSELSETIMERQSSWVDNLNPDVIEELCGVWHNTRYRSTIKVCHNELRGFSDLEHFKKTTKELGYKKIEPMPRPVSDAKRETPEWMKEAIERYPRLTEWD